MRRPLLLLLVALTTVSGCALPNAIDPDPERADVREQAAQTQAEVQGFLDAVRAEREPLATAAFDVCEVGQDNWKVETPWTWRCELSTMVIVDGGEVEAGLREQQRLAEAAGCTSYFNNTQQQVEDAEWLITTYWRPYRDSSDYTARSLPRLQYDCPGGIQLEADPSDDRDEDPLSADRQNPAPPLATTPEGRTGSSRYFRYERPTDAEVDRLWAQQAGSALTLIVTASTIYYEE